MSRPRKATSGYIRQEGPSWIGYWWVYPKRFGKPFRKCKSLGKISETTEKKAQAKLDSLIAESVTQAAAMDLRRKSSQFQEMLPLLDQKMRPELHGCVAEMIVCLDLISQGWEIFKPVSPTASCDMIGLRDGQTARIEVKKSSLRGNGTFRCDLRRNHGKYDIIAFVCAKTRKIYYQEALASVSLRSPKLLPELHNSGSFLAGTGESSEAV